MKIVMQNEWLSRSGMKWRKLWRDEMKNDNLIDNLDELRHDFDKQGRPP